MSNKPATFSSLAEQNFRPLVLLLSGLLLFGSGMLLAKSWQVRSPPSIKYEVGESSGEIAEVPVSEVASSKVTESLIKVDVSGAVNTPKVCELAAGSRVEDALDQAGGLSDEVDKEWVLKNLNLAAKLTDGEKLYIPREGEVAGAAAGPVPQPVEGGGSFAGVQKPSTGGLVNINTASQSELESLTGIGPVKAQAIIDYRSRNPFDSIEEVMEVKGVWPSVFEKIKDRIVVR